MPTPNGRYPYRSHRWVGHGGSIVVVSVGRPVLPATNTETTASLLRFATIQCIESEQDLAGLAPKERFIPAKPVERVAGQIGQTQKATCEVDGGIIGFRPRAGPGFRSVCGAVRRLIGVGIHRISPSEPCVDNFLRLWLSLAALPELTQIVSLDFEQSGFHCCGTPQSPQQASRNTSSRSTADQAPVHLRT